MERVRVVVCGCLLALGLSFCPTAAFASDGFLGGLEDLTGTREVENVGSYESDYIDEYEPEFREVRTEPVREIGEDATTVDYINDTVNAFNKTNWGNFTIVQTIPSFFRNQNTMAAFFTPAIALVFVWWGVRKSKNVIMSAFRKGKAKL